VTCAFCGVIFTAKNAQTARYCPECRKNQYKRRKDGFVDVKSDNQKLVSMRCSHCEKVFQVTWEIYRKGRKYCSTSCQKEATKKLVNKKYEPIPMENKPVKEVKIDYDPHPGQVLFHASPARFRVLCCANRWGKDRCSITEFVRLFVSMLSENRPTTLIPRVMGWIVAPTYMLARQSWRELKSFFPEEWVVNKNESEKKIETIYDGVIEVKSADDPESLVSVGLDIVLMTEVARAKNLQDIWANLFARLSSDGRGPGGKGGVGIFNSTPLGRGFFHTMYQWGQNPEMPEWESWQFDCYSSPYIKERDIEIAKRTFPEKIFRQNWLAEFLSDSGEVFANVDKLSVGEFEEPIQGRWYKAAWDPSQRVDLSVFGIRDQYGRQVYKRVFTGMLYEQQLDIIEVQCKRYNNALIEIDMTSGGETLPREAQKRGLQANGIYWSGGGNIKQEMVSHLCVLMEQEIITLLNDEQQKDELKSYTYQISKSGHVRYSAPSGETDDHVSMLIMLYRDFHAKAITLPWMGLIAGVKKKVV
jgi:ribosomal protein L33